MFSICVILLGSEDATRLNLGLAVVISDLKRGALGAKLYHFCSCLLVSLRSLTLYDVACDDLRATTLEKVASWTTRSLSNSWLLLLLGQTPAHI